MASRLHTAWTGGNEGFVSTWYLDPVHIPTIGHGLTWENDIFREWWTAKYGRKFKRGDTISLSDSLMLLGRIIDTSTLPAAERAMPHAKIHVKEAASDTAYNAGTGSLTWKWAKALAAGNIKEGARLLRLAAVTGRGSKKKLPGLVRRRDEAATLVETGRYPAWVMGAASGPMTDAPRTHIGEVEVKEAQLILASLGYSPGPADGIPGPRTVEAVRRFQTDHGTLKVDGILGRATITALVRTRDARTKGKATSGVGAATAASGAAENATGAAEGVSVNLPPTPAGDPASVGLGWIGDALFWGGAAIIVIGLAYLAWRYRDELPAIIRRLA